MNPLECRAPQHRCSGKACTDRVRLWLRRVVWQCVNQLPVFEGIHSNVYADEHPLVGKGDVHVSVGILHRFYSLGCQGICHMDSCLDDPAGTPLPFWRSPRLFCQPPSANRQYS